MLAARSGRRHSDEGRSGDPLADARLFGGQATGSRQSRRGHAAAGAPGGNHEIGSGANGTVVGAQIGRQARREHRVAVLAALELPHTDDFTRRIDIGNLRRNGLGDSQAGAIIDQQCRAVAEVGEMIEKAGASSALSTTAVCRAGGRVGSISGRPSLRIRRQAPLPYVRQIQR